MSQQASYKAEIHELYTAMLNMREKSEMQAALSAKMCRLEPASLTVESEPENVLNTACPGRSFWLDLAIRVVDTGETYDRRSTVTHGTCCIRSKPSHVQLGSIVAQPPCFGAPPRIAQVPSIPLPPLPPPSLVSTNTHCRHLSARMATPRAKPKTPSGALRSGYDNRRTCRVRRRRRN